MVNEELPLQTGPAVAVLAVALTGVQVTVAVLFGCSLLEKRNDSTLIGYKSCHLSIRDRLEESYVDKC